MLGSRICMHLNFTPYHRIIVSSSNGRFVSQRNYLRSFLILCFNRLSHWIEPKPACFLLFDFLQTVYKIGRRSVHVIPKMRYTVSILNHAPWQPWHCAINFSQCFGIFFIQVLLVVCSGRFARSSPLRDIFHVKFMNLWGGFSWLINTNIGVLSGRLLSMEGVKTFMLA